MMFAAGMGVGLLFYGAAEPISHYLFFAQQGHPGPKMTNNAQLITIFNWGLHAWAIYGITALVIAYFSFRKNAPQLLSGPIRSTFGSHPLARGTGWVADLLAIYAIAIGLAGSLAMGVFQVQDGVISLFNLQGTSMRLTLTVFAVLCAAYILPLMVDLSKGMAVFDTVMNILVFAFVGALVWLYFKDPQSSERSGDPSHERRHP